jgi:hypothetical protein
MTSGAKIFQMFSQPSEWGKPAMKKNAKELLVEFSLLALLLFLAK